jgi:excisionase family DNA binding protein
MSKNDHSRNIPDAGRRLSYTIEAAVEVTGLARTRLFAAISDGSLASFRIGRRRMISAKALEAFIAGLERQSAKRAA